MTSVLDSADGVFELYDLRVEVIAPPGATLTWTLTLPFAVG